MSRSCYRPTDANRKSRLFAVTAPYTTLEKSFVFESLEDICFRFCVSEEKHYDGTFHHHIYMRTIELLSLREVKQIIGVVYDTIVICDDNDDRYDAADDDIDEDFVGNIHVSKVRSEHTYLKYITKQDSHPLLKNIDTKKLSFFYRAIQWAKNTQKYEAADPFVLGNPQFYNLLKQVHASVHSTNNIQQREPIRALTQADLDDIEREDNERVTDNNQLVELNEWKQKIISWWNDWAVNGFHEKKKQLYLWGPSNTGKTRFIRQILSRGIQVRNQQQNTNRDQQPQATCDRYAYEQHIFSPTPHDFKYSWQEFDPRVHSVMKIDEFCINEYNVNDFKKALEGESIVSNNKGVSARRTRLQMPMIVISNHDLPDESKPENAKYKGLHSRFIKINTNGSHVYN